MDHLRDYLPVILIALLIAAALAFLLLRPRQRVRLSNETPLRPHMAQSLDSRREGNDVASEAAAAACDVAGEIVGAPVHRHLANGSEAGDDLTRLKGVGPKLAGILAARGLIRFDQIARLTGEEVELLDEQLGAFRGRIQRDRIVEQAQYLARGDSDGFEQHFGKL